MSLETTDDPDKTPNPNSALYWMGAADAVADQYPVRTPDTAVVSIDDFTDLFAVLDGEVPATFPTDDLETAADQIGYPVFVRTDLSSAKHDGVDAVRADDAEDLQRIAAGLVADAAKKFMHPAAFLVREWIDVDSRFEAFDGLPIGVEFRVFATPDEHLCTHYYRPEDSIRDASLPERLWTDLRDELTYARKAPWFGAAARMAAFEADFRHGIDESERAWSVDFARDENGEWYLIDMALAEDSWHPDCDAGGEAGGE
jgi:hypothetical protein